MNISDPCQIETLNPKKRQIYKRQREFILNTAARLFAKNGYNAVTMNDICNATSLSRGAMYYYIKNKEDLLYEIAKGYMTDLVNTGINETRSESDPRRRLLILGHDLIRKITEYQTQLTVCFKEVGALSEPRYSEVMAVHKEYEGLWSQTLRDGATQGVWRAYDRIVLKGILGMYFYSYLWIKPNNKLSADNISNKLNEMTLRILTVGAG